MAFIEQLEPSKRWRAFAWDTVAQKKVPVKNQDPRSRGTFDDEFEAMAAARAREQEMDGICADYGTPVLRNRRRVKFGEYAATWLKSHQTGEKSTCKQRAADVRALTVVFGETYMDALTEGQVGVWLSKRASRKGGTLKPQTMQNRLTALGQIMRSAIKDGLRLGDPTEDMRVSVPNQGSSGARILTEHELNLMMKHLPDWFAPAALLAYDSGFRAAEVAGLRWHRVHIGDVLDASVDLVDVMDPDGVVRPWPKGKNPQRGHVLTPRTARALRALRERYPTGTNTDHVFRHRRGPHRGSPLLARHVGDIWALARAKAGLTAPVVKFHDLRHACATNLARAGASAMEIKAVMRHKNLATSQRYIEEVPKDGLRVLMRRVSESPRTGLRVVVEVEEPPVD
jgi:integrase